MGRARLARLLAPLTAQGPAAAPWEALRRTGPTGMARGLAPPMAQQLEAAPREALGQAGMARGLASPMRQAAPRARLAREPPTVLGPAVALQETLGRATVGRASAAVRRVWPGREVTGGGVAGQEVLGPGGEGAAAEGGLGDLKGTP